MLGPVGASGERLTSPTQVVLASVLAANAPHTVSFRRLIDAIWDDPPASAENSLHSHLSRLRRVLGAGSIVREGSAYRLAAPTDAAEFTEVIERPGAAGRMGRREELRSALSLWRGEAFGDCADHRFVRASVEALGALRGRAIRELAGLELAAGEPDLAVAIVRPHVEERPLDEEVWAVLVEALDASGRRVEALRASHEASLALSAAGLEASRVVREAERRVLRLDEETRSRRPPSPGDPFVGRDTLLERLEVMARSPGWVTLVGPGGVGKTRVASEFATRVDGAIVFCDLTEVDAADVEEAMARAAGVPRRPPYLDRVATRLGRAPSTLVLDCCEGVTDQVAVLGAELLGSCPELRVLATSRVAVGLAAERLLDVEPLEPADAAALLRTRLADAGVESPTAEMIDRLCTRVDRLPLTIEMLAGMLRSLPLEDLVSGLDDPIQVFGGSAGHLAASLDRSLRLLDEVDRSLFARLSLFRAPFVVDLAHRVGGPQVDRAEFLERLRSLRELSLLSPIDGGAGRRLRMLDTVRSVGRTHLERSGDRAVAEKQFVAALRDRALEMDAGLRSSDEVRWAHLVDAEIVDLRAAHRLAVRDRDDAAFAVVGAMFHLAYDRVRPEIAAWAAETVIALGDRGADARRTLAVAALEAMHTDRHDVAWRHVGHARRLDPGPQRHVELVAANLALRSADLASANDAAKRCTEAALQADDLYTLAIGYVLRALAVGYGGDLEQALEVAADARRVARSVGAPTLLSYADYVEGELLSETQPELALELLDRAHERAVASGSSLAEGISLVTITSLHGRSSDPGSVDGSFAHALQLWHDRGDWNRQWVTLRNLAEFLSRTDREQAAATIVGAVDAHGPAAFGAEGRRFEVARERIASVLGDQVTMRLCARGRSFTRDELLEHALEAVGGH